jgi:hypothetical protein
MYSPRIRPHGDRFAALHLSGFAKAQMIVLEKDLRLRKLNQGVRRVHFEDGTQIICSKCFNIRNVDIFVPVKAQMEETNTLTFDYAVLTIIHGNPEEYLEYQLIESANKDETPTFVDGEAVFCEADDGYGLIEYADSNYLYGEFIRCSSQGTISFVGVELENSIGNIVVGEDSGARGNILDCLEKYYQRKYEYCCVIDNTIPDEEDFSIEKDYLNSTSAFDRAPLSDIYCLLPAFADKVLNWWSKTYDDFILVAFVYYPQGAVDILEPKWSLSVSYKNHMVTWNGAMECPFYYKRKAVVSATFQTADTHVGFDIWSEEDDAGGEDYYIAALADQEKIFSCWKFNPETIDFELINQYYSIIEGHYSYYKYPKWHVRLLGFGRKSTGEIVGYWGVPNSSSTYYYKETFDSIELNSTIFRVSTREIITSEIPIVHPWVTAIWSPTEKELYIVQDSQEQVVSERLEIDSEFVEVVCYGYTHLWPGKGEVCWEGNAPEKLWQDFLGWEHDFTFYDAWIKEEYAEDRKIDFATWAVTHARRSEIERVDFYDYSIVDQEKNKIYSFAKGCVEYHTGTNWELRSSPSNYCSGGAFDSTDAFHKVLENTNRCIPETRYDYVLAAAVFAPTKQSGGVISSFKSLKYKELFEEEHCSSTDPDFVNPYASICTPICAERKGSCDSECFAYSWEASYWECQCSEYAWKEIKNKSDLGQYLDTSFPFDRTWASILLRGNAPTDISLSPSEQEVLSNWVIYRNSAGFGVFDNYGIRRKLIPGEERAFFKQQYFEVEEEV